MRRYSQASAAPSSAQPIVIHWWLSCSGIATVAKASAAPATSARRPRSRVAGRLDAQQLAQQQRHHDAFGHRHDADVPAAGRRAGARFAPAKKKNTLPATAVKYGSRLSRARRSRTNGYATNTA